MLARFNPTEYQPKNHARSDSPAHAHIFSSAAARPYIILRDQPKRNAFCPHDWDKEALRYMIQKPYLERMKTAGALLAAEISRCRTGEVTESPGQYMKSDHTDEMYSEKHDDEKVQPKKDE